jgi:hypothetical protein
MEEAILVDIVSSYVDGESKVMNQDDTITIDDIERIMEDHNYERCMECEAWTHCSDLVDADCNVQPCSECR